VVLILKNIGWILGTGGVACILFMAVQLDWMNYAGYLPELDQIASVSTSYTGRFEGQGVWFGVETAYTDPESIGILYESHKLAVENRPADGTNYSGTYNYDDYTSNSRMDITYTLKSGRKVERRYHQYYTPALLQLSALDAQEDFIRQNSALFRLEETGRERFTLYDSFRYQGSALSLSAGQQKQLMFALRADQLAETLGELQNPTAPAYGYLEIEYDTTRDIVDYVAAEYRDTFARHETVRVLLSHEFTNTVALLEEWGYAGQLGKERESYDKVSLWFHPDTYNGIGSGVQTIDINVMESYIGRSLPAPADAYQFEGGLLLPVEDTKLYDSLYSLAQDRVLMAERDIWRSELLYIVFEKNNIVTGIKFIWKDRLPQELTEQYFAEMQALAEDTPEVSLPELAG
jgi:hypothetical protein